jgi:serine/threonine protein kinase
MSWEYNAVDNSFKKITVHGKDIFRKVWNTSCIYDMTEREICLKIKEHPHKNLVTVYDVTLSYVDEEMLDIGDSYENFAELFINREGIHQIHEALNHLHGLGIVYIDLKMENIGWSNVDKCYKLFDFNGSGTITADGCHWHREPMNSYIFQGINDVDPDIKDLRQYDNYACLMLKDELLDL